MVADDQGNVVRRCCWRFGGKGSRNCIDNIMVKGIIAAVSNLWLLYFNWHWHIFDVFTAEG